MLSGKCDVRVVLHQPDNHFRAGDTITGDVIVEVNKPCDCHGLILSHEWRTHGRGNKDSGTIKEETLFQGRWQQGTQRYPFSFTLDADIPATYHGDIVNIDNYLKARADIPWALDPKADVDFIVIPAQSVDFEIDNEQTVEHKMIYGFAVSAFVWFFFLIFAFGLGELAWSDFQSMSTFVNQHKILTFVTAGFILLQIYALHRYRKLTLMGAVTTRMRKALREPRMVDIELEFKPKVDMFIEEITANLVRQERATSGSGTNETTHYKDVVVSSTMFPSQQKHQTAGTSFLGSATLSVPEQIEPSFSATDNGVTWLIELRIKTDRSKDFKMTEYVTTDMFGGKYKRKKRATYEVEIS